MSLSLSHDMLIYMSLSLSHQMRDLGGLGGGSKLGQYCINVSKKIRNLCLAHFTVQGLLLHVRL